MRASALVRLVLVLGMLLPRGGLAADSSPDAAVVERAAKLYASGLAHLQADRPQEALTDLDASVELFPSPNTDLLRGHALRELGRRVEAMAAYERVVRDAGPSVRAGETRFEATLEDAGRWVALLKTELGEVVIEVRARNSKVVVTVNGEPIATRYDRHAKVARGRLWHEPGSVEVRARGDTGIEHTRTARVAAGSTQALSFDVTPPRPPERVPAPSHAPPLTSAIAFGVGAAGFATLAVAGILAKRKMSDLDACRPRCARSDVDDAERKATIANVGLVVGIAGALTGGGLWLGSELGRPSTAALTLSGRF
jgi:hypothetical protein